MENIEAWWKKLRDPNYDITEDGFHVIDVAKCLYDGTGGYQYTKGQISDFVEMVLFRVVRASPAVFAITIGQFPYFEKIEEYWKDSGFVDPDGFTWLRKRQ